MKSESNIDYKESEKSSLETISSEFEDHCDNLTPAELKALQVNDMKLDIKTWKTRLFSSILSVLLGFLAIYRVFESDFMWVGPTLAIVWTVVFICLSLRSINFLKYSHIKYRGMLMFYRQMGI